MKELFMTATAGESLAQLLALAQPETDPWTEEELGAILQAQLAQPLPPVAARREHSPGDQPSARTLGDLFRLPAPPLAMLRLIKDQMKADRRRPNPACPERIAYAIYYLCIAAALVRCQTKISTLGSDQLLKAFAQFAGEAWMDKHLQTLLQEAITALRQPV